MIQVLQSVGIDVVVLSPEQSKHGAVETHEEAKRCAALFRGASERIDGVIVSLPNFGDERAIADTLRLASLNVPVLIQATPDTPSKMGIAHRRDSFCGKMSACNNLKQYGIPYSLTTLHTVSPNSGEFKKDLEWFCRSLPDCERLEEPAHRGDLAPGLLPSTPCAIAKSCWKLVVSPSKRWIFLKFLAASAG